MKKNIEKNLKKMGLTKDSIKELLPQIEKKFKEQNILNGWTPVLVKELKDGYISFNELLSVSWRDGKLRCHTIGITDVKVTETGYGIHVEWSDETGDPDFYVFDYNIYLDKSAGCGDGECLYGLYKKVEKF